MDVQESALKTLDPGTALGSTEKTSQELLDGLRADWAAMSALVRETGPLQDCMAPHDWIGYIYRMKILGEPDAMRSLRSKFAPQ